MEFTSEKFLRVAEGMEVIMKQQPLVSIIIPIYNVEQYLAECMGTILGQTYDKLDIILVDDGSKDNSGRICDEFATKDSRIQVLHKQNGGLISAWMAGVELAKGDYLAFVDSDDWVELNMIEELVHHLNGVEKEIICSNYIIEKTEKKQSVKVRQSMKLGIYDREKMEIELFPDLLGQEERRIHASRCMKLISKDLILNNMKYVNLDVTMGEDLSIMLPTILDAERIVILEEGYFYHYRLVEASMAHKYNPNLCGKVELLYLTLQDAIDKKLEDKKELFLQALKKEYIFLMFYVLKNELRGPGKNCIKRIKKIVEDTKKKAELANVEVSVNNRANQLLYRIWKQPGVVNITITRWLISIFDRR